VLRTFGVLEALQRTLHGDANIGTSSPNITCFTRRSASKKISLCNLTQSLPKRRREKLHRSLAALAASNLGFERTPESIFLVWSWSRRSSGGTVDPVPCRALTKGIEREREPVFRERKAKVAGQSWHGGRPWDPSRHWHRSVTMRPARGSVKTVVIANLRFWNDSRDRRGVKPPNGRGRGSRATFRTVATTSGGVDRL